MIDFRIKGGLAVAGLALAGLSGAASADEPKSPFTYSFNVGATTDYVFRGYSQHRTEPTLQGGIDLSYAVTPAATVYFGIWGSAVDFGQNFDATASSVAGAELDVYGGVKYTLGPATVDLGVIWYTYPGAKDGGGPAQVFEQDYVELKAGISGAFVPNLDKLTTGATVFYSPSYQGHQGEVVTLEGTAAYELPKVWVFVPSISGTLGGQFGSDAKKAFATGPFVGGPDKGFLLGNGKDSLMYWNAGLTLALDKLSFDFRYWDTNVANNNAAGGGVDGWCNGSGVNNNGKTNVLRCDERFVFTAKFTY